MPKDVKIPDHYQTVMPYLIVKDASGFSAFMQHVFDAEETHKTMRDDQLIMHGEIVVGGSTIMFADGNEQYGYRPAGMFIYVDNADERHKKALEKGASVITRVSDQPYGRSGGVLDPFGNTWWITSIKR